MVSHSLQAPNCNSPIPEQNHFAGKIPISKVHNTHTQEYSWLVLEQKWVKFPENGQIVDLLGIRSRMVCVAAQLLRGPIRDKDACVLITLHLQGHWAPRSGKGLPDLGSDHDVEAVRSGPASGYTLSLEPA